MALFGQGWSELSDTKGERREQKRKKKRYGHKVRGRSVQTLQRIILERADVERARETREEQER